MNINLNILYIFILLQGLILIQNANSQSTILDVPFFRTIRRNVIHFMSIFQNFDFSNRYGKFQDEYSQSEPFFCDSKNGPGKRSLIKPDSIHRLKPGDVDIIAAMGDSMIAANGAAGVLSYEIAVENRGKSWAIGGESNWRKYITLPNIIKEFNPNLYGYSEKDGLSTDRTSKFNVAEGGAMSRDMHYQAQILLQRLKHDPNVNMKNDWKILTLLIGANDFCIDICYRNDIKNVIKIHERDMIKTLRFLRDNIPKLMVNWVVSANVTQISDFKGIPERCDISHIIECPCFIGKTKDHVDFYNNIIKKWIKKDYEIAYMDEFNTNNFTINIQPFTRNPTFPMNENGLHDIRFMSADCFHFSQRLHALASNGLWNNLLEPDGTKVNSMPTKMNIKCPTEERPFIATRENSKI